MRAAGISTGTPLSQVFLRPPQSDVRSSVTHSSRRRSAPLRPFLPL